MYKAAKGLLSISLSPPPGRHPIFLCSCQISPLLRVVLFASSVLFIIFGVFFCSQFWSSLEMSSFIFFNCQQIHEAYLWLKMSVIKTSLLYEMQVHTRTKMNNILIIVFGCLGIIFCFSCLCSSLPCSIEPVWPNFHTCFNISFLTQWNCFTPSSFNQKVLQKGVRQPSSSYLFFFNHRTLCCPLQWTSFLHTDLYSDSVSCETPARLNMLHRAASNRDAE